MFLVFLPDTVPATVDRVLSDTRKYDRSAKAFPLASPPLISAPHLGEENARKLTGAHAEVSQWLVTDEAPLASRLVTEEDAVVDIGGVEIGGRELAVIAGPCSVDTAEYLLPLASELAHAGARFLRGGAYKPRTSPYAFNGLGLEGLEILRRARSESGLPVITEALDAVGAKAVAEHADAIQIGARSMQAFGLLHDVAKLRIPVVLKRGFGCTIDETLHAAEHLLAHGAPGVVLVERGIRTFEQSSRFTFDLCGALALKQRSRFPVLVDPSHAAGDPTLIGPLSRASVAAGLDGLMIEVHSDPTNALSDKDQALTMPAFSALLDDLRPIAAAVGRTLPTARSTSVDHAA